MANPITNTAVTVWSSSTEVIAWGTLTVGSILHIANDSDEVIYLALGGNDESLTAVMNEWMRIPVNGEVNLAGFMWSVAAICASGGKNITLVYQ